MREVWGVGRPCLRTRVLCSCTCDPLKDLLIAEEALGGRPALHEMDEGLSQVLLGVQHLVVAAGTGIHGQSLQQPNAGDHHVHTGVNPEQDKQLCLTAPAERKQMHRRHERSCTVLLEDRICQNQSEVRNIRP